MSEIVQGALIGIVGAIVGAAITAIVAYINTKSQLNLRLYEIRTDRLIKARERVLIPLREKMSHSLGLAEDALKQTVIVLEAHKRGADEKGECNKGKSVGKKLLINHVRLMLNSKTYED